MLILPRERGLNLPVSAGRVALLPASFALDGLTGRHERSTLSGVLSPRGPPRCVKDEGSHPRNTACCRHREDVDASSHEAGSHQGRAYWPRPRPRFSSQRNIAGKLWHGWHRVPVDARSRWATPPAAWPDAGHLALFGRLPPETGVG